MKCQNNTSTLFVYLAVVATLLGGIGAALMVVAKSAVVTQQTAQDKSPLQVRLESAREIREALAKPVPAPQPLPPITAKLSKPLTKVAAAKPEPVKQSRPKVVTQAREVFASFEPSAPQRFFGFMAFGPGMR